MSFTENPKTHLRVGLCTLHQLLLELLVALCLPDWWGFLFWPIGSSIEAFAWSICFDSFATVFLTVSIDVAPPARWFGTVLLLVIPFVLAVSVAVAIVTIVTSTSARCASGCTSATSSTATIVSTVGVLSSVALNVVNGFVVVHRRTSLISFSFGKILDFDCLLSCFRECSRILCGYKLHNCFWKSGDEKILEVLEMSVSNCLVVNTLADCIGSVF
jgi:hypothetical protein